MEVPGAVAELEGQQQAAVTAVATPDLSCVCDLHYSSGQYRILSPWSEARDRTCVLVDTGQVLNPLNHNRYSLFLDIV